MTKDFFTPLAFLHANKLAQDGKPRMVSIIRGSIAGYDYNEPSASNVIYTIGGIFPVKESLEEIHNKITALEGKEIK